MLTNDRLMKVLDHHFGGPDLPRPATLYLGLSTTTPNLLTGANFTEPSAGAGYERVPIDNDTFWGAAHIATSGPYSGHAVKLNVGQAMFNEATSSWGTPSWAGLFESQTGGAPFGLMVIGSSGAITTGMQARFGPGRLTVVTRRV